MMTISKYIVPLIAVAAFSSPVFAAEDTGCDKPGMPQQIDGKVVKVDVAKQELTIQDSNGMTHVLKGSEETLKKYKAGDSLKASLRCPPK